MYRERFIGLYAGLAVVAWAAIFMLVLVSLGHAYRKQADTDPRLRDWSTARILAELGEYDQKIPDCAGLVQGMTGYAYAKFNRLTGQLTRVVIICKP